jgi:recombinase-like zinc beta ribbon protein
VVGNPSYTGKVIVEGELVEGLHPALVDEQTWRTCQEVKRRNVRRTSKAWTKHTYPLTPILLCARCGGPMHGEATSRRGRIHRYYGCHAARRNRSAVHPPGPSCDAGMFKSEILEEAIHHELSRFVPTDAMHSALRSRLRNAERPSAPRKTLATASRRLDEQLERARRLFEYGEYDWETFCARRDEIYAYGDKAGGTRVDASGQGRHSRPGSHARDGAGLTLWLSLVATVHHVGDQHVTSTFTSLLSNTVTLARQPALSAIAIVTVRPAEVTPSRP